MASKATAADPPIGGFTPSPQIPSPKGEKYMPL